MNKDILVKSTIQITIASAIVFFIHTMLLRQLDYVVFANHIVLAYVVNVLLALAILYGLYFFRKKLKDQMGFLFMAGSLLKFAVFFIVFYPKYSVDGQITRVEFVTFFVPYVTCLVTEAFGVLKLLKNLD
ncbi:DUF6168 family protein [Mangrovimonas sp. TPBH4]|uniref:DUF6168 family protein n=1 Tax=Mangrovimonas sp. TPBH4 TaxID=1645914 RepID=UPI0006B5C5FE|nr:DUF6168 family protein [Mangrovimonas sp. TPBH4]